MYKEEITVKFLLLFLLLLTNSYALEVKELPWPKGESFLTFLEKNSISSKLYFDLNKEDQELCSEIRAGVKYQVLFNTNGTLKQVLIPISEEMQLHLDQNEDKKYSFQITPIVFKEEIIELNLKIKYSPYQDILNETGNKQLANEFIRAFSGSVNFRRMQIGDNIAIKFKQRFRLGQYYGMPQIISALTEVNKKKYYIFKNDNDGKYYNDKGKSLTSYFFKVPLSYSRISSKFTYKRWHPVLKRYRAHLGVDYAAPRGRAIYSSADGRITFAGRKGGYGKVIEIQHKNGYKTLYAHQSKFKPGMRRGKKVRKGQQIGYVGTTGRSTGPHLHFGLYKNGRAVNPLKIVRVTKTKLKGSEKKKFLKHTKALGKELLEIIKANTIPLKLKAIETKTILEA